jgi:hypothetical protein
VDFACAIGATAFMIRGLVDFARAIGVIAFVLRGLVGCPRSADLVGAIRGSSTYT